MPSETPNPFEGTEAYYARYRPEYGESAIEYLRTKFDLDESSRVLDLGCGTGQIAIPLAAHVGKVVGMDPNEDMLREARRRADAAGRENLEWVVGSDADVGDDLGTFELTTMGRSFHWMEWEETLERLYRITESGGGVAILNDAEWLTRGTRPWQDEVYALTSEYIDDLPPRTGPVEEYDDPWDELLRDVGFADVEVRRFEREREWDVDSIVGYVFSLSFCSPETFGDDRETFEEQLRSHLSERDETTFVQEGEVKILAGRT